MATPAIWLQLGGTHEPMSPEWQLWEAGVPLVGGGHGLSRAKRRFSSDPPCPNCGRGGDPPAIKRLPSKLPERGWVYYHSEVWARQGGATLAADLAARAGALLVYVDTPTREAVTYVGVLDAAFREAGRRDRLLVWYHRRDYWRKEVGPWHVPGVEAIVAQRADYLTTCPTPAKRAAMPETDRFEQAWSDKLVIARCDPIAALAALAAWESPATRPELPEMCDAELAEQIRSGEIIRIVAERKAALVAEAQGIHLSKEA